MEDTILRRTWAEIDLDALAHNYRQARKRIGPGVKYLGVVKAVLRDTDWYLEYEGKSLDAGALSREEISPAVCLPRLMNALRDGWLLEENEETWNEVPCLRVTVDQSGTQDGKIVSTVWLRQDDGTPLRGEIAVDGEIILTAEFTAFAFCDMMEHQGESGSAVS